MADVAAFGEAARHYFNEVDKLLASAKSRAVQEFCFLLTYIHENDLELAVEKIQTRWNLPQGKYPLVLVSMAIRTDPPAVNKIDPPVIVS